MANITERKGKRGTSYRIRVSAGFDQEGKQVFKVKTWKSEAGMTAKQIEKALNRVVFEFEEAVKCNSSLNEGIKFEKLSEIFLEKNKNNLAAKTYERYEGLLANINNHIGTLKLSSIQPHHITSIYDSMREEGANKRTGGSLSPRTILHSHRVISLIFNWAEFQGIIRNNPMRRVKAPKVAKTEAKYLDSDDLQKVISALEAESIQWKTMMFLFMYSGIRRGEMLGLEWDDIDFDNRMIHIRRTSQYVKGHGIITKSPKNETSKRSIKLDPEAFELLGKYRSWWAAEKLSLGESWQSTIIEGKLYNYCQSCVICKKASVKNYMYCNTAECNERVTCERLFIQENGVPMHPDSLGWWILRFIEKNNLPKFSAHTLRHGFVTNLIANGVPLPTISKLVGHSNTTTTANIYSHSLKAEEEKAMEVTGGLLNLMRKKV
ncbi:MAG: tyrosine-type recombinase/integrase [Eubacteriales bacterium]|nr:tyrosine-type recombinase/integrase [Eubacteriales bacterium]